MAEPLISRKRSWTGEQKKARKKRGRKLKKQMSKAEARAKYGKKGKPAPVTVKYMDGTAVEVDQDQLRPRGYSPTLENMALSEGFESYAGYLGSTVWRDLRRRALTRDQWRCRVCGSKKNLQVHHDHYNVLLRSDQIGHLKTMCSQCHRRAHGKR